MILNLTGRRPLPVKDYVVSIEGVLCFEIMRQKFESDRQTDKKLDMETCFFVIILPNMDSPNF